MLDSRYSYDFRDRKKVEYAKKSINEHDLHLWSRDNLFRTTYTDNFSLQKNRLAPVKSAAIPGYKGFIPGLKSENLHGSSYTPLTKEAFANPELGNNSLRLSSTG